MSDHLPARRTTAVAVIGAITVTHPALPHLECVATPTSAELVKLGPRGGREVLLRMSRAELAAAADMMFRAVTAGAESFPTKEPR